MECISNNPIRVILVLIAMEAEAKPFIESLQLVEETIEMGVCRAYKGIVGNLTIVAVIHGKDIRHAVDNVGTVPAAVSTYIAVSTYKPDLIINAGTAGGFQRVSGRIGDVYICNTFNNHDRRINMPGFVEYGVGQHTSLPVSNIIKVNIYYLFVL